RPEAELVQAFQKAGGAGKPVQGGMKACLAPSEDEAVAIAHKKWRSSGLPGEMSQVLPTTEHFEQVSELVTPDRIREEIVCGPDPAHHLEMLRKYEEA